MVGGLLDLVQALLCFAHTLIAEWALVAVARIELVNLHSVKGLTHLPPARPQRVNHWSDLRSNRLPLQ
jgi:hypothetical protein